MTRSRRNLRDSKVEEERVPLQTISRKGRDSHWKSEKESDIGVEKPTRRE